MEIEFQKLLSKLDACDTAREWAGDKTLDEVWQTCERGDWMLWLAKKVGVDIRPLTLAKAHCAELVLHLMKDERSKTAVEVAIRYGEGNATDDELSAAAYAAYAASYTAYAAAYAAYAAADAAAYTAYAAYAADAAAYAAYAADAAAYAASYAAKKSTLLQCADICRQDIPVELIKAIYPNI